VKKNRSSFLRKFFALTAILFSTMLVGFLGAPAAQAEQTNLTGNILSSDREPIAGVKLTIRNESVDLGSVFSDSEGAWSFPVSATGYYWVQLDQSTLPEGQALTEGTGDEKRVNVLMLGFDLKVLFPIGEGVARSSTFQQTMQLMADGAILGLIIALAALGLNLVYGTTGLTNFAHGELLTLGGLLTYFLSAVLGLRVIIAIPLAILLAGFIGGYLQNKFLWKPLRRRGTGLIAMLVISIGFAIFVRYFYLFIFGGDTRQLPEYAGQAGLEFGPVSITPKSLITTSIGIALLVLATLWLVKTRMGKASRAVSDNPALASASGVEVERVIRSVWILGAVLAGYAGIIITVNQGVSFLMGQDNLLLIFAAVTLGGLGTAHGAVVGSMVIGLFIQLSTLFIPTELKYVGALLVLIVILLVRPQGILGKKDRVG
jgi:neutral amino acid transport system permease protein